VLLEGESSVGASWRRHYDRLHLHTVKEHSHLPGTPFGGDLERYPSREQVVAYLEAYAARFALAARTGEAVRRIRAIEGGFTVESATTVYRARAVVVATGTNRVPNPERLPEQERFRGAWLHSADYRSGASFAGRRVLVVGAGNTGAELALDLAERGARPTLSVRGPVNIVPREFLGLPTQVTGIRLRRLPLGLADGIGRLVSRLAFGDLARLGFGRPALGPLSATKLRRRVPLIDVGTIAAVKRGEIAVNRASRASPRLEPCSPTGARPTLRPSSWRPASAPRSRTSSTCPAWSTPTGFRLIFGVAAPAPTSISWASRACPRACFARSPSRPSRSLERLRPKMGVRAACC
jgi:cation diffusion facilitator CzcD-associated flavoprotein CzcO